MIPAPLWDVPACRVSADVARTRPHPDHTRGGVVMHANIDPALAAVVELVREIHAPIDAVVRTGGPVAPLEAAALTGAVGALLDAINARTRPAPARALKAVS